MRPRPYISVIIPTFRPGGLDMITAGLRGQEFRGFELVLVDMIKRWRGAIPDQGFPVRHVEPINSGFPFVAISHTVNTGIVHSSGEVAVLACDHYWMPPDCLQRHADFHRANPGCGYMGCHSYLEPPPFNDLPPVEAPDVGWLGVGAPGRNRSKYAYVEDLNAGKYDHVMWSILADPVTEDPRLRCPVSVKYANADWKLAQPSGWADWKGVHFKHESFPVESALAVNGCDEDLDGTQGYHDSDFAERMQRSGVRWYRDSGNVVWGFPGLLPLPRLRRIRPTNRVTMALKRAADYGIPESPDDPGLASHIYGGRYCNDWDLREYRDALLREGSG